MDCFDHYPWGSEAQRAVDRADLLLSIVAPFLPAAPALMTATGYGGPMVPPGTPSPSIPAPPALPPSRFVKFGDSMVCLTCNLDVRYCRGHGPPSPPPPGGDGSDSDLNRRIRDVKGT